MLYSNKKNVNIPGSQAGIKFATPMLVVPTSNFFSKNQTKFTYLVEAKITKFELGWWAQANYSQNQTLFIVNYEGFLID